MKKIAIGQAGGPTVVINASLVAFVEYLFGQSSLYAIFNGYEGLVKDHMEFVDDQLYKNICMQKYVPGACLGSGRYNLTDAHLEEAVKNLKKREIDCVVFIGGNGTMTALEKLVQKAQQLQYDLQVIGIPKTVDNDLGGTDHAPGFASAAKFVSLAMRDSSRDLQSMRNFEHVRIVETMGRNVGWLAASSGYYRRSEDEGPHLIYIPEKILSPERFLEDVKEVYQEYGFAHIAVSEGVTLQGEKQVEHANVGGRTVLGGVSKRLENLVKNHLGLVTRAELLGMNQRASFLAVSKQDLKEATEVGRKAAQLVLNEETYRMVTIERRSDEPYQYQISNCLLDEVTKVGERTFPQEFISDQKAYYNWLKGIIGEDIECYPPSIRRRVNYVETPIRG